MSEKKTKKTTEEVVENTEIQEETTPVAEDSKEETKQSETAPQDEKVEEVIEATDEQSAVEEVTQEEVDEVKEEKKATKKKKASKDEDFDWDKLDSTDYTQKERDTLEQEYLPTLSAVEDKKVLDGTVVRVTDREVIVDINFKSDGVIGRNEFRYNPDLKAGDIVEVLVEKQEDKNGQLILSHRRARVQRAWEKVNVAQDTGEIIEGTIKSRTKGGMIVEVFGIEAFLPGSQIDVKPIRDYDEYVGKKDGVQSAKS